MTFDTWWDQAIKDLQIENQTVREEFLPLIRGIASMAWYEGAIHATRTMIKQLKTIVSKYEIGHGSENTATE